MLIIIKKILIFFIRIASFYKVYKQSNPCPYIEILHFLYQKQTKHPVRQQGQGISTIGPTRLHRSEIAQQRNEHHNAPCGNHAHHRKPLGVYIVYMKQILPAVAGKAPEAAPKQGANRTAQGIGFKFIAQNKNTVPSIAIALLCHSEGME